MVLWNIWSGYSRLKSMWDISQGLRQLRELGYTSVGLADWYSLAGAEVFDRVARAEGLHPWLGITGQGQLGGKRGLIRLFALDSTGWESLCALTLTADVIVLDEIASPHLIMSVPYHKGIWLNGDEASVRRLSFTYKVIEVPPDHVDAGRVLCDGWRWVPAYPVRYIKREDDAAYEALAKLGETAPDPEAAAPIGYSELVERYQHHEWSKAFSMEPPPSIFPKGLPALPKFSQDDGQYLTTVCWEGLRARGLDENVYGRRLEHELAIINHKGFAAYFLIVKDIVDFAQKVGIRVGPGRGSAAGSLVSYVLGITDIDPLRYGLIFERFLNPDRKGMPDIDLDFDFSRRGEIFQYLSARWGPRHVAHIGTYGTLGARAVIRDVGKLLGIPLSTVGHVMEELALTQTDHIALHAEKIERVLRRVDGSGRWFQWSQALEGLPRHKSIHAAGVILSMKDIPQVTPCDPAEQGGYVTQMEMESLERLGFLKLDILGLRTLTVLNAIEALIDGPVPTWHTIDHADRLTLYLLARGETTGIFQLDGHGVKSLLRQMHPQNAEEVMAVVALYRPGPMDAIRTFLKRRAIIDKEAPLNDANPVDRVSRETYGVLVYQEQLIQLVQDVAGYSVAEADTFRRAISKKNHVLLQELEQDWKNRLMVRGYAPAMIADLWKQIMAFADYGFNKSHATAYGLLSYYMSYLKAHYPLAFWCGELSSVQSTDKLSEEMGQAVASGIVIHRPHINSSRDGFRIRSDGEIEAGLTIFRGMSAEAARKIMGERDRGGPFTSRGDAVARLMSSVGPQTLEVLERGGALGGLSGARLGSNNQISLFEDADALPDAPILSETIVGFNWPHSSGSVYVKIFSQYSYQDLESSLARICRQFPGELPVVLVVNRERGRTLKNCSCDGSWGAIDAMKGLKEIFWVGRSVIQEKEWPDERSQR